MNDPTHQHTIPGQQAILGNQGGGPATITGWVGLPTALNTGVSATNITLNFLAALNAVTYSWSLAASV